MASRSSQLPEDQVENQHDSTTVNSHYGYWTSETMNNILTQILQDLPLGINGGSKIHDNASGPGTATSTILEWRRARGEFAPAITATNADAEGIKILHSNKAAEGTSWDTVSARLVDPRALEFPTSSFDFSFCNFSILSFAEPDKCLAEIHRTLKPRGIAVITCWKTFGPFEIIHAAQKAIKSDGVGVMKANRDEFLDEGYLAGLVGRAGWESGKIKTLEKKVVMGRDLEGIMDFLLGYLSKKGEDDWSDEDNAKWPAAVEAAVEEHSKRYGGILFEAWVVLARKWDELYG